MVRHNIVFSLGMKAVFLVLTLGGVVSMWAAVAADSGTTLLVVFNALRLLRGKSERTGRADATGAGPSGSWPP